MGDGSLSRAVFQSSLGEVFRGSCRARKRSVKRGISCLPVFHFYSFRVLSYTYFIFVYSLFLFLYSFFLRYTSSLCPFHGYSTHGCIRRTLPSRKRPRESSSRFASLVKRMRDFAYRISSQFFLPSLPLSLSLSHNCHPLVSPSILYLLRLLLLKDIPFVCFYLLGGHILFVHDSNSSVSLKRS